MDYSKIIIFSDLDDTLLNKEKKVSLKNKEAIFDFISQGGIFSISSGRNEINTQAMIEKKYINGPSILYNGSVLYDFQKSEYIKTFSISAELFDELFLDILKHYQKVDVMTYNQGSITYITPFARVHFEHYLLHAPCNFMSWDEDKKNESILKVLICGAPDDLESIKQKVLHSSLNQYVDCVTTHINYLELLPKGINKGTSLLKIKEIPEYKDKLFIAIGDYYNDIELLTCADVACCPSNAIEAIKEIADYQTSSCDEDAIAHLIYQILPKLHN